MIPSEQATPLEILKLRTRLHHQRAEAAMPPFDGTLTIERYRDMLVAFHSVYAPLEERLSGLAHWPSLSFDFGARRKAGLIERDLRALGCTSRDVALLPKAERLPDVDPLPRSLGAMYVMEGATLGGQVIRRLVQRALPSHPVPVAFFASYGDRVGQMWNGFRAFVTANVTSSGDIDAMVDAAAKTFDAITERVGRGRVTRAA